MKFALERSRKEFSRKEKKVASEKTLDFLPCPRCEIKFA
jgi:hypothetical protein